MQVYEMGRDWDRNSFTDLKVVSNFECERDWEAVYERIFYGLDVGCDCINIGRQRYYRIEYPGEFQIGIGCNRNETLAGCETAAPLPPVRMQQLNGKRICGKANGPSFREAVLPEKYSRDYICPDRYKPCILNAKETYCYKNEEDPAKVCPITDIKFVKKDLVDDLTRLKGEGYTEVEFDTDYMLMSSKTHIARPVTNLKIGP